MAGAAPLADVLAADVAGTVAPERERLLEVLVFEVAGQAMAIPTSGVVTVLGARDISPLPDAPLHVLGMVPHEGRLLAVVDLGRIFGAQGSSEPQRLVLVSDRGQEVALATSRVDSVELMSPGELQSPLPAHARLAFVEGQWLDGSRVILSVSPHRLLKELIRMAERGLA